jgi:Putative Ig domain
MQHMKFIFFLLALLVFSSCSKNEGHAPSTASDSAVAPNAPTGLTATEGNSSVVLTWLASTPENASNTYTVMRSPTSGSGYVNIESCVSLTVLSCTDSTAVNGTLYFYIVVASNSVGTSPSSNEVSATPTNAYSPPGSISYLNSAPAYTLNVAITNNTPTVNGGGPVTAWSIAPDLTAETGLDFNTSTGVISGTPTIVSHPGASYTITAANSTYGNSTVSMTVRVSVGVTAPTISYSGMYTYQAGLTPSSPITPTLGGGTPTSCSSSPALPAGLVINSTTCVISGTPTATAAQQLFTITAGNSAGTTSATVNIGVLASGPTQIAVIGVGNFTTAACALFTLTTQDVFGNSSAVSANTTFNLSGAGTNGAFYSDSACTSSSSSVVVPNGSSSEVFYYRKTTTGSATLSATLSSPANPALGSASRSVTVTGSTPAKYRVVIPATGTTVSCNSVSINVLDASDNSVNATSSLTVNLSGTASATFFSDAACSVSASSLSIAVGANSGAAYMRKTSVGSSTITASSVGMASGTGVVAISVAPAQRLIFSSLPAIPYAASTCQAYTLQSRDALSNNTSAVSADTIIALSGTSDGSFYSNSTCTLGNEISSTTLVSGTSSKVVYYLKPTSTAIIPGSNIILTAAVTGWSPSPTTSVSVSSGNPRNLSTANAAVGLAVSTSTNVATASKCLLTTVRAVDELNALVPANRILTPITATLSGGGAGAQFWSNATCTTPTSTVTINAGSNTGNFYYSSTTTTSVVPIAWTNGGLSGNGGSRNVTVSSGIPSRATWTAGPSTFNINTCQTYTLNVRDPNTVTAIGTNVTSATDFQLSDGSDGQFFSAAGCSNQISTVRVAAGAQAATFYYRKATVTPPAATISVVLQAPTQPAIATLNQTLNVSVPAPVPNNIFMSAAPSSNLVATQSCSLINLQSRNGTTLANVTANSTYTLSGTNGAQFFYDSGCTVPASPISLTILNGTNSISGLYIKTANVGSVTISGAGSLTVNNLVLSYAAPAPTMLALSGPILMNAGTACGAYKVTTQDSAGVDRNVSANTAITFTSTGSKAVQFYSNSTCSTALPSSRVTISSGSNNASFYVRGNSAGSAEVQASGSGLTSATYSLTIQ